MTELALDRRPLTPAPATQEKTAPSIMSRLGGLSLNVPARQPGLPTPGTSQSDLNLQVSGDTANFQATEAAKLQQIIKVIDPKAPAITFPDGSTPLDNLKSVLTALGSELKGNSALGAAAKTNSAVASYLSNPTGTDAASLKNLSATLGALQDSLAKTSGHEQDSSKLASLNKDLNGTINSQTQEQLANNGLQPLFQTLLPGATVSGSTQADRTQSMLRQLQSTMRTAIKDGSTFGSDPAVTAFLNESNVSSVSANAAKAINAYVESIIGTPGHNSTQLTSLLHTFDSFAV